MKYELRIVTATGPRFYENLDGDEVFDILTRLRDDFVTSEVESLGIARVSA